MKNQRNPLNKVINLSYWLGHNNMALLMIKSIIDFILPYMWITRKKREHHWLFTRFNPLHFGRLLSVSVVYAMGIFIREIHTKSMLIGRKHYSNFGVIFAVKRPIPNPRFFLGWCFKWMSLLVADRFVICATVA